MLSPLPFLPAISPPSPRPTIICKLIPEHPELVDDWHIGDGVKEPRAEREKGEEEGGAVRQGHQITDTNARSERRDPYTLLHEVKIIC